MKTPNLREWQPTEADAKNVDDTKMLNTTAREPNETVDAKNTNTEYTVKHGPFGMLGANGRT